MASDSPPSRTHQMSFNNILSPPETVFHDSFNSSSPLSRFLAFPSPEIKLQSGNAMADVMKAAANPALISPVSQYTSSSRDRRASDLSQEESRDPTLFNGQDEDKPHVEGPLFPQEQESQEIVSAIHQHIARKRSVPTQYQPRFEEYALVSNCFAQYKKNPSKWWSTNMQHLEYLKVAHGKAQQPQVQAPEPPVKKYKSSSNKRKHVPDPLDVSPPTKRSHRAIAPRTSEQEHFPQIMTPKAPKTPQQRSAPKERKIQVYNYQELPDFSPPLSSLSGGGKGLKADWKQGNAIDLSKDPERHLLHDTEIALASTLRFSCSQYLLNKRLFFKHVVDCLRRGKAEFRKTDAQQACAVDVNKASRLWVAFERVGWLDRRYFEQYL